MRIHQSGQHCIHSKFLIFKILNLRTELELNREGYGFAKFD